MKKGLPLIRQLQKGIIDAAGIIGIKASAALVEAKDGLKKLDDQHKITEKMKDTGAALGEQVEGADKEFGISNKKDKVIEVVREAAVEAKATISKYSNDWGVTDTVRQASDAIQENVTEPVSKFFETSGAKQNVINAGKDFEEGYGELRSMIKPYFPPESEVELYKNLKEQLINISACIMQISADEAEKVAGQFGAAIASKLAGIATTAGLFMLVGSFGTAGTGAAIASLSGAAASNATLAWVGGLLGGGMATGVVLTGGIGLIVGLTTYRALHSERRSFENLTDAEQRIVQTCWYLISVIDDLLKNKNADFNVGLSTGLLINTLIPLHDMLKEHSEDICTHLDGKHAVIFRQHVLTDFQRVVIDGFRNFSESIQPSNHAAIRIGQIGEDDYVIAGVIYALLTRTAVDGSVESQLVLKALRRSDSHLAHASEAELSSYLSRYDAVQLKGIANNVKGIYHEELWVQHYNETHKYTYAQMFEKTNHPGADVQIIDKKSRSVVEEIQLKATDNTGHINEHLEKYRNIEIRVTAESADQLHGVKWSGFENADITGKVNQDLDSVADNTLGARVFHSAEFSTAFATGHGLIEMLRGETAFPQAVEDVVRRIGTASAATLIAAYLFG